MKTKYDLYCDIAVIGAGPAGSSTSIFLSKAGIKHIIFDKATFPRDKICGDGLSGKVVGVLKDMELNIIEALSAQPDKFLDSWGVRFAAPNGRAINIPFTDKPEDLKYPPGFIAKRQDFDAYLVSRLNEDFAETCWNSQVIEVNQEDNGVLIRYRQDDQEKTCFTKLLISAEGERSLAAKKFTGYKMQPEHYYAGLRGYYENVSDIQDGNYIELHFLDEALPGYLWIFPLPNNQANVGIGMLSSDLREQKVNLKNIMLRAIERNRTIRHRFKEAKIVSKIEAWGLPLGSQKPRISGDHFLLTGDAASLIDPFTGEGIGNALLSGQVAAEVAQKALKENDFSATFLQAYDDKVYDLTWDETNLSYKLQRLVKYPHLFNFVVNRLYKNRVLRETFSSMFNDLDMRAQLRSPLFYLKLLFSGK